jgi:hypothetical protein
MNGKMVAWLHGKTVTPMPGKSSQYLPDTESIRDEDELYATTITYRYERDDSDYVTKIFEKRKRIRKPEIPNNLSGSGIVSYFFMVLAVGGK